MAALTSKNESTASTTSAGRADNDDEGLAEWIALSERIATALDPKAYCHEFWQAGTRPDGRAWAAMRPTTVVPNVFGSMAGSALVKVGNDLHVAASVALQIGQTTTTTTTTTTNNTDELGDVQVQIEPSSHQSSSSNNNNNNTVSYVALQSRIQRWLEETMDWTQLAIRPGLAWRAVVTIHLLLLQDDHDDLTDVVWLAAVAALQNAQIPTNLVEQHGKLWLPTSSRRDDKDDDATKPFAVPERIPICVTAGYWKNPATNKITWWVDPTATEQVALDGRLTVLVDTRGCLWGVEFAGQCVGWAHQHLPLLHTLAVERAREMQQVLVAPRK